MGYANKEGVYWWDAAQTTAQSLAEDLNGLPLEVRNNSCGMISLVWSGAAATDAVVKVQDSVDGIAFYDISGKTVTIAAAAGSGAIKLTSAELLGAYIRLVITDNTESAGTITAKFIFKGDR